MRDTHVTKVIRAGSANSLRTTVPRDIAKRLGLEAGSALSWNVVSGDDGPAVKVSLITDAGAQAAPAAGHAPLRGAAETARMLKKALPQHADDLEKVAKGFESLDRDFVEIDKSLDRVRSAAEKFLDETGKREK